ncbi:MAG: hypothetical protein FWC73_07150 [Defluviitaleaceae bacterium]|nr:hypothetical protein [Defluviitaleaceae bacterium]
MFGLDAVQRETIGLNYVLTRLEPDSPYGREKLKHLSFLDQAALEACFDNIEKLMDFDEIRPHLAALKNIRGSITKTETLTQVDIFEIKHFLITFEKLHIPELKGISLQPMSDALAIVDPSGLRIATYTVESPMLYSIRKEKLRAEIIDPLLVEQEVAEETRVLQEITKKLRKHTATFLSNMNNIGELDLTMAKARLAQELGAARPILSKREVLSFKEMGNPYIAETLKNHSLTKIFVTFDKGITIITGANMGGKSVALKSVVLNTLLCRAGFFVFAQEAEVPLFDGVCMISEEMEDIGQGLSSFGGEMTRLNEVALRTKSDFLFIALDEPARGTNPEEGAAIVRGVANHLATSSSICVIATHYNQVTSPRFKHYQVAGLKGTGYMDYNLVEARHDAPPPKDALKICKLIGLNKDLLAKINKEVNNDTNTNIRP